MTGKQITILIVIVALIALVIWGGFRFLRQGASEDVFTTPTTTDRDVNGDVGGQGRVVVTHEFANGTHHYTGSVMLPTPCHELAADATVAESFPEQTRIVLTTVPPVPDTVCIQVLARGLFDLNVSASEGARLVGVTLDGVVLPFELFEEAKG